MNLNQGQGKVNGNDVCYSACWLELLPRVLSCGHFSTGTVLSRLVTALALHGRAWQRIAITKWAFHLCWREKSNDLRYQPSPSAADKVPRASPMCCLLPWFPLRRMKNVSHVFVGRLQFLFRLEIDVSGAHPLWRFSSHEAEKEKYHWRIFIALRSPMGISELK